MIYWSLALGAVMVVSARNTESGIVLGFLWCLFSIAFMQPSLPIPH